jgi:hypothetical protein
VGMIRWEKESLVVGTATGNFEVAGWFTESGG